MSVLNCVGEPEECPLCMEPFEIDDLNFFPCTCGYQICRFCWHRIRTDENGLCPACRKAYPENPANFKPLTQEELQHIKQEKRQKDLQRKQKVTENRKHLANVRVVQKNLVFVVGLSSRLADPETLKKSEYFGKFGKMLKVVINHSTTYAGSQGPSASAYVTYQRAEDALRAIQAVNNIHVDGRILKASLGTTKYCSHFMKNQQCPKADCMYLHELGDESASFTKEEMQQGKHQEFEKKLQEQYLGTSSCNSEKTNGISPSCSSANINATDTTTTTSTTPSGPLISTSGSSGHATNKKGENSNNTSTKEMNGTNSSNRGGSMDHLATDTKESWPALHVNSNKEHNSKRTRSKSERTLGSARHTPTEENNKRNNREREKRHGNQKENSINHKDINIEDDSGNSSTTTTTQSQSLSTTPCSTQESCTSSASTTPPPQNLESLSVPPTPPHSASSPMPVVDASRHRTEREQTNSPLDTTPSSLSSCSELSSSLPPSQQISSLASSVSNSVPRTSLFLR
ncbi:CCR4-NOT transcription complex subunit 4 [Armadillidium vulgare]|nr:CCR4-NOT transcription complex subunit 4 [Armadillidium vulgare]